MQLPGKLNFYVFTLSVPTIKKHLGVLTQQKPVPASPLPPRKELLIPQTLHKNNFDLIRLLLAISVLYCHSYYLQYDIPAANNLEPLAVFTRCQTTLGTVAVDYFFIISGFLIVNSFLHCKSLKDYFKKRVLRIYPGFWVAFLLSVFLFALLGNIEHHKTITNWKTYFQGLHVKSLIADFLLLKQPTYTTCFSTLQLKNVVNGSMWTIQFELICYLLLPVLGIAGALKRKWISLFLFLLFYTIMELQLYKGIFLLHPHPRFGIPEWLDVNYIPKFFAYFFCGLCVYLYRHLIPRNNVLMLLSLATLVLSSTVFPVFHIIFPFAGAYLLFYIAYSKKIKCYHFAKKGDLSYGVYLYAFPVQQLVLYFFSPGITLYSFIFISLSITLFIAYFWSWKCIEKPFIDFKRNLVRK